MGYFAHLPLPKFAFSFNKIQYVYVELIGPRLLRCHCSSDGSPHYLQSIIVTLLPKFSRIRIRCEAYLPELSTVQCARGSRLPGMCMLCYVVYQSFIMVCYIFVK